MPYKYYDLAFTSLDPIYMFMSIIFWIVVILVIIYAVNNKECRKYFKSNNSLHILKNRYAKGEIDKKEFEERYADLEGK